MKILICAHEYYPKGSGIANVAYNLRNELAKTNEVEVLSPIGSDIKAGCQKLIEKLGGIGIYFFWKGVFKYIKKTGNKYDIIWMHNPLFAAKSDRKLFCTVHTTFTEYHKIYKQLFPKSMLRYYYKFMSWLEKRAYKRISDSYIFSVTSTKTREELKNLGVKKEATLISNGVNTEMFKPADDKTSLRQKLSLPVDKKIFLFVGRIDAQKKTISMIDVFAKFNSSHDYALVVVGDGPLLPDLKEYAEKINASDVFFTGKVKYEQVRSYYSASDFFIMGSVYEGQPLSLLEALSSGLVPILSKIPIFEDAVIACNGGLTVDFSDPEAAAAQVINFINKTDMDKESSKIREFSKNNISWEKIAVDYVNLFRIK